ncbi:hypothetical protein BC826DRAFT_963133 [Russula brevipes]|nr:hypothetical protein BC826DRAFT_963133 [Russula brevipes]
MFGPSGWALHGDDIINRPPPNGTVEVFEPGKAHRVEIACHRMYTSMENVTAPPDGTVCPPASPIGYHTDSKATTGGCGLAVYNSSDIEAAKDNMYNFVVFSVNHSCPYYRDTYFEIPEDMPSCGRPEGCICTWNWIHFDCGGMETVYQEPFRCDFKRAAPSTKRLAVPKVPTRCVVVMTFFSSLNRDNCTKGAKQPMYWLQLEGNNMFGSSYPLEKPPTYRSFMGFEDGAQNDIFEDAGTPRTGPTSYPPPANQPLDPWLKPSITPVLVILGSSY